MPLASVRDGRKAIPGAAPVAMTCFNCRPRSRQASDAKRVGTGAKVRETGWATNSETQRRSGAEGTALVLKQGPQPLRVRPFCGSIVAVLVQDVPIQHEVAALLAPGEVQDRLAEIISDTDKVLKPTNRHHLLS